MNGEYFQTVGQWQELEYIMDKYGVSLERAMVIWERAEQAMAESLEEQLENEE